MNPKPPLSPEDLFFVWSRADVHDIALYLAKHEDLLDSLLAELPEAARQTLMLEIMQVEPSPMRYRAALYNLQQLVEPQETPAHVAAPVILAGQVEVPVSAATPATVSLVSDDWASLASWPKASVLAEWLRDVSTTRIEHFLEGLPPSALAVVLRNQIESTRQRVLMMCHEDLLDEIEHAITDEPPHSSESLKRLVQDSISLLI